MPRYNYNPLRTALRSLTFFSLMLLTAVQTVHAQTKIGGAAGPGDASAVLELQSTSQGLLPPRMTTAQRNAVISPATGLTIYNTDDQCLNIYTGSTNGWFNMCSGGGGFSFTNCSTPVVTGTIALPATNTAAITLNYVNSTGQTYAPFTSSTVNGITLTAPGGAITPLTAGSGSIILTATGTPTGSGNITIPIVLAGTACAVPVTIAGCSDPSSAPGSTGCVAFTYRGAPVTYTTVRAKDGHVWLQQNLGSARVATSSADADAYGDLFQWGRWDDGHQVRTPPAATAATTTLTSNNPSGLGGGSANFYTSDWWAAGTSTDTWSGTTATATNGKDPCAALGTGWRMPTSTEWATVTNGSNENITNTTSGYNSNLKMPTGGFRSNGAGFAYQGQQGMFWTTLAGTGGNASYLNMATSVGIGGPLTRGYAFAVRCIK